MHLALLAPRFALRFEAGTPGARPSSSSPP